MVSIIFHLPDSKAAHEGASYPGVTEHKGETGPQDLDLSASMLGGED